MSEIIGSHAPGETRSPRSSARRARQFQQRIFLCPQLIFRFEAMPLLPNPRHEKFAQALAKGKPACAAYEEAGYRRNDGNAVRMKGNEKIKNRVSELQGQGAERAIVTLEGLIADASDIQTKALAKGHYSAAVSALTVKAKLSGHWVDRTDNKTSNVIYAVADEPLTEDEWSAKHAE